jgi:hypothetical protein
MEVSDALKSEFRDKEALRSAITSNKMYTFPKLYNIFCLGMESGKLRGMHHRTDHCALPDMLSISYEAHFRVELHCTMSEAGYRHLYSKEAVQERSLIFKRVCRCVKNDRMNNGNLAWAKRQTMLVAQGVSVPGQRTGRGSWWC